MDWVVGIGEGEGEPADMSTVMLCKAESTVSDVAVSEVLHGNLEVSRIFFDK